MKNFDGALIVTSAVTAFMFVGCGIGDFFSSSAAVANETTDVIETIDDILEDVHHFISHYMPAMLTGYGLGRVGEAGVKKLQPLKRIAAKMQKRRDLKNAKMQ